jgi:hypothetical protein
VQDKLIHHMIQTSVVLQDIQEADLQVVGSGQQGVKVKTLLTQLLGLLTDMVHLPVVAVALVILDEKKEETGIVRVFVTLVVTTVIALEFYSVMHITVAIQAAAVAPSMFVKQHVNAKHGKVGVNKVVLKMAKAAGEAAATTKDVQWTFGGDLVLHQTITTFRGMLKYLQDLLLKSMTGTIFMI